MMMAHRFSGLFVLITSASLCCASWVWADPTLVDAELGAAAAAQRSWSQAIPADQSLVLDEQIFTDLSPLLDSLNAVRLPEDQRSADEMEQSNE